MKPVVISYREWWFYDLLCFFPMGLGVLGFARELPLWQCLMLMIVGTVCIAVFSLQAMSEDILSEEGITRKRPGKTVLVPWKEVIQVGAASYGRYHNHSGIFFTFRGGKTWEDIRFPVLWELRNRKTGLGIPWRADAEACVRHFYGPLDFDQRKHRSDGSSL